MNILTKDELFDVDGGASSSCLLNVVKKIYRTIKIKLLMKKLFT
jgi:hypothetical protein